MTNMMLNTELPQKPIKSVLKSILLSLPMLLILAFLTFGGSEEKKDVPVIIASILSYMLLISLFFLMIHTGKTNRYRTIIFIFGAFCFALNFMTNMTELRGTLLLTESTIFSGETPFCHLAIPMIIIPAALTKTIIFPGSMLEGFASIGSMIVIWVGASVALGKGWCSWVCFFGGFDEGFSRLCKKPKIKKIDRRWTLMPVAVLLAIILLSAALMRAVYCEWICPFKAVTEISPIIDVKTLLQTTIVFSLFIALVIVLPILTGKRTQCSLFCPFGALQSLTNKINIFEMRIDRVKCIDCGKCVNLCPTLSMSKNSMEEGKTLITCTKCGKCTDDCPKNAISYHIKGTPIGISSNKARILFLYVAFIFMALFIGANITGAVSKILRFAVTGSLI